MRLSLQQIAGKALFIILGILLCLTAASCSPDREQLAAKLVEEAQQQLRSAQQIPNLLHRSELERKLSLLLQAQSRLRRLHSEFPETNRSASIKGGEILASGYREQDLSHSVIPKLIRKIAVFNDPLTTAEFLAGGISTPHIKQELLLKITQKSVELGRGDAGALLMEALMKIANELEDPHAQARLLATLALMQSDLRNPQSARALAFSALSAAKRVQLPDEQASAQLAVAEAYLVLDVPERAMEALRSIINRNARYETLDKLGIRLLERNNPQDAIGAGDLFARTESKAAYLMALARWAKENKRPNDFILLANNLRELLATLDSSTHRNSLVAELAKLYRESGMRQAALGLLEDQALGTKPIRPSAEDQQVQAALAIELAAAGSKGRSQAIMQPILTALLKGKLPRSQEPLATLAVSALAHQGQFDQAANLCEKIEDNSSRINAAVELAIISADSPAHRAGLLQLLVDAKDRALRIEDADARVAALLRVNQGFLHLAANKEVHALISILRQDSKNWRRYLRRTVQDLIANREYETAKKLADEITDFSLQVVVIADIAKALAAESEIVPAAQLMEKAISSLLNNQDDPKSEALGAYILDSLIQMEWAKLADDYLDKAPRPDSAFWQAKIAGIYLSQANKERALSLLERSLAGAIEITSPSTVTELLIEVGSGYARAGIPPSEAGQAVLAGIVEKFAISAGFD